MTTADIFRLVGVAAGLVIMTLGVVVHLVGNRPRSTGEWSGCLALVLILVGAITVGVSLP